MAEMVASGEGKAKLYVDLLSPFSRSVAIFRRINNIEIDEVSIAIVKGETRTPEYKKINPMLKVPCLDEGDFKLRESHAILRYLATTHHAPGHWYPQDPRSRAVIDSVLEWSHSNFSANLGPLTRRRIMFKLPGRSKDVLSPQVDDKEQNEKAFQVALDQLESVFLEGSGKFLDNGEKVSIADLSLVCVLNQLQLLDTEDQKSLLGSRERIKTWMDAVADATNPHFLDVHTELYAISKKMQEGGDFYEVN